MGTSPLTYEFRPVFADRSMWSLPAVLRHRAATHGNKTCFEYPQDGTSLTFGETLARSELIARNLLSHASSGERVLVMAPNSPECVFSWFAINVAGLVHVPINTAYRGNFLHHQVQLASPVTAIIDAEFAERFVETVEGCASIRHFLVLGDDAPAEAAIESLQAAHPGWTAAPFSELESPSQRELPTPAAHELGNIYFTSGTTGLSKGVMMPSAQVHLFAEEMVAITGLTDGDTYMNAAPMFHGNTPFMALMPSLIAGSRFVLYDKFSPGSWVERARSSGATHTNLVGVMMDWVRSQEPGPGDREHDLRCVCAIPTPSELVAGFQERFGIEQVVEAYGSTESCLPVVTPPDLPRPKGSCGLAVSCHYDVRLVDPETDEEVPVGEVGELVVRPHHPWTTCLGYYEMPDKTAAAFRNLWFHTGDGLRRDENGWYYFVDRFKDAIRRRGENISSFELEQALLAHPSIVECAVVAVPADQPGSEDEVMAFVVCGEATIDADTIWEWGDRHLPRFLVPRYLSFIDELPKTPSERVKKSLLRETVGSVERVDRERVPR